MIQHAEIVLGSGYEFGYGTLGRRVAFRASGIVPRFGQGTELFKLTFAFRAIVLVYWHFSTSLQI
jgi:hypothetical protein